MDAARFDALSRSLIVAGSRRQTLAAVLSGALGWHALVHPGVASAARSGRCKQPCGECERCQKGACKKRNGKKRCKPGRCVAEANDAPCAGGSCCDGRC